LKKKWNFGIIIRSLRKSDSLDIAMEPDRSGSGENGPEKRGEKYGIENKVAGRLFSDRVLGT
jgi:hypothetical protein